MSDLPTIMDRKRLLAICKHMMARSTTDALKDDERAERARKEAVAAKEKGEVARDAVREYIVRSNQASFSRGAVAAFESLVEALEEIP